MLSIGIVSQKGGVGKSTIARLLAVAYARAVWRVKIADFDPNQTSTEWVRRRLKAEAKPEIVAETFNSVELARRQEYEVRVLDGGKGPRPTEAFDIAKAREKIIVPTKSMREDLIFSFKLALRQKHDLVVIDGQSHNPKSTLEIAKLCDQIIIPTGTTLDDLIPSVKLAIELKGRGIDPKRIMIVLNATLDSSLQINEARRYLNEAGYKLAVNDLPAKSGYRIAQNTGRSILETTFPTLNQRADQFAQELIDHLRQLPIL